jgi:hypothetical protein
MRMGFFNNRNNTTLGTVPSVITVNGKTGTNITLFPSDLGLERVTNDTQVKRAEMGSPNGIPTLDTQGKVPITQMSSQIAHVVSVTNKAARLALETNSVLCLCLQADTKWMWALNADLNPSVESNWIDCGSTASSVISVNGNTGAVTISCDTLGAVPTTRKVNSKALSGDIVISLSDIVTLPNDPAKFLNGQGQWVKITSLSTADALTINWRDYYSEDTPVNHNGDRRIWTYQKAYGLVLPSGTDHKITQLVWSQGSGYNFSGTGYVIVYNSGGVLYRQSAGMTMNVTGNGAHVAWAACHPQARRCRRCACRRHHPLEHAPLR